MRTSDAALEMFRNTHGFGRAISAPQIDRHYRMIAMNLGDAAAHRSGDQPFTLCNPRVTWKSEEKFSMWDDCMSHPDLVVRLLRHCSISIKYEDIEGREFEWNRLSMAEAELVQHEMDHLDGILSVDRAEDAKVDIVQRRVYETERAKYDQSVDYAIEPTIARDAKL